MTLTSKKVIEKDPKFNPLVRKLFEWFATGQYSLLTLAKKAHEEGLRYRRKVHSFAFQGLITCGHCGSQYTAKLKKGRYVYYHCSKAKGRCPEKYVPESELVRQLGEAISMVRLDEEILQWMLKALRESHKDKKEYHDSAVAILEDRQRKLRDHLDAMYVDKLDGKISTEFFEQRSEEWRRELEEIERKRAAHFTADDSYIEEGAKLIELDLARREAHAELPKTF